MREQTCCFTGHRELSKEELSSISTLLEKELERLILSGVIYFGAGGALGFDTLAAKTVLKLKNRFPQIRLILVLPCKDQSKSWSSNNKLQYEFIKSHADKIVCMSEHYVPGCMQRRNRALIDGSRYCLCYLKKISGGTAYTVNYAQKSGLHVINLAQPEL